MVHHCFDTNDTLFDFVIAIMIAIVRTFLFWNILKYASGASAPTTNTCAGEIRVEVTPDFPALAFPAT